MSAKKPKLTKAQELLAIHLREILNSRRLHLGIVFEHKFAESIGRKWPFDVAIPAIKNGFECNGHWQGRHGAGWSKDAEKMNHAQALGWKVFVFTNREVLTGKAKKWLEQWL